MRAFPTGSVGNASVARDHAAALPAMTARPLIRLRRGHAGEYGCPEEVGEAMEVSIRLPVAVFALAALVMMVPAAARADAGRVSVVPRLSPDPAAVAVAKARAAGGSKRAPATGGNTTAAPPTTDAV